MNEFLQRLKQRKLVQWAIAYIAAAFALLQGIDIVAQQFGWPEGVRRGITLALVVGFFVTLVLAWYHGERGAQKVSGSELLIVGLVLALGGGLLWRFAATSETRTTSAPSPVASVGTIPAKSIAVLPFENLSDDKGNAYFAEGVQDEILTRLAKVADLKVISRTSTQNFKSSPENLPEIAKQLGVAHILEGSVQKANDQVRVNVQLIKAATDAHLWAETFDRKLTDIFAVESEIAKNIADQLQAKLTGAEKIQIAKKPTENQEAYELYLKGRFFWNKRTASDLRTAIDYFNQAIEKDPGYAQAYAGLGQSWVLLSAYNGGAPKDTFPQALAAANKALALDPACSEAIATQAYYKANYEFDYPGALKDFERALALNPNDATTWHWYATTGLILPENIEQSVTGMKRAVALDPLSLIINANLGLTYLYAGRVDDAAAQIRKTIEMDKVFFSTRWYRDLILIVQGRTAEAMQQCEKDVSLFDDPNLRATLGYIYGLAGRTKEAETVYQSLLAARKKGYVSGYALAVASLGVGDKAEALRWIEQCYQDHDGEYMCYLWVDPLLNPLRDDPRFEPLAKKITGVKR